MVKVNILILALGKLNKKRPVAKAGLSNLVQESLELKVLVLAYL